jgi:selenophosphate synthase
VSAASAQAQVALTALADGAGCGCKLPAAALLPIAQGLPQRADERLLVGSSTADDAAGFRLTGGGLLVAVPAETAHALPGPRIGEIVAGAPGAITVR